ncbi:MAG: hypothetical protein K2N14_04725 [Clostridia bacterium]|nr:hypothetical protein [Clostridia bacterium]
MSEKIKEVKTKIKHNVEEKKKNARVAVKNAAAKLKHGNGTNTVTSNRLKLLVTVVGRSKAEYYADLIQSFDVNLQVLALAEGTADAKTLRYLGLTDSDKGVIFSVIQEEKLPDALHTLGEKFNTVKDGKGIAFTVPLSSVIGKLIFGFLSNNRTVVKEEK